MQAYALSRKRDNPRQGVVANTLKLHRNGAVRFIGWLDPDQPVARAATRHKFEAHQPSAPCHHSA